MPLIRVYSLYCSTFCKHHILSLSGKQVSSLLKRLIKVADMERTGVSAGRSITGVSAGRIITIPFRDRIYSIHLDGALTQELCQEADQADDVEDAWVFVVACLSKGTASR